MLAQRVERKFADTPWLLEQWALWSRVNPGPSMELPSVTPYRRLLGSTVKSPVIDDDTAMLVDAAVSRLVGRDASAGRAVILYHFTGGNVSGVAKRMRVPRWKVDIYIKTGICWIDGALNSCWK